MIPDLELVIHLQGLDQRIADLEKEVSSLPKHISQIEKTLDQHIRKLEADRAALTANEKDRKRLDGEIQSQHQKISKLKEQMLQAKTNDQYRAFQHEIDFCEKEIQKAEDGILEQMSASEPLHANVKTAESALAHEKAQVEHEKSQARERTAAAKKQLEELRLDRKQTAVKVTPSAYKAYERIRKKWKNGNAVAEATEGVCTSCQINLRPQYFQDLKRGEELLFCESCGRILFYNPPIAIENGVGPATAEGEASGQMSE